MHHGTSYHIHATAHRLPVELVLRILLIAADQHIPTAHTLAHVSRSVCALTAPHRWRTIVITSFTSLLRLWATILEAKPTTQDHLLAVILRLLLTPSWSLIPPVDLRVRLTSPVPSAISLPRPSSTTTTTSSSSSFTPQPDPGAHVRNLLLDTTSLASATALDICYQNFDEQMRSLSSRIQPLLSGIAEEEVWSTRQIHRRALDSPRVKLATFLRHFPNVDILSLGANEYHNFSLSLSSVSPIELGIVYHGNTTALAQDFTFSIDAFSRDQGRVELAGVRRRLKRLHIVAIDPQSTAAGVEPPFSILEPLRAGSTSQGSLLDAQARYAVVAGNAGAGSSLLPARESTGLVQLRYDTRCFALRPASITAGRLRHFLQEPTLSRTSAHSLDTSSTSSSSSSPRPPSFSYTGRPHAAPPRGAGSHSFLSDTRSSHASLPSPLSVFDDESSEAILLREWGVGEFSKLHLSWKDANAPKAEDLPAWRRARYSALPTSTASSDLSTSSIKELNGQITSPTSQQQAQKYLDLSGGWPREIRDVWTERSDRDQSTTFEGELADCVYSLYGWKPGSSGSGPGIERDRGRAEKKTSGVASSDPDASRDAPLHRYLFAPPGQGEMGERIPAGYLQADRSALAIVAAGLTAVCNSSSDRDGVRSTSNVTPLRTDAVDANIEGDSMTMPTTTTNGSLQYAVRAPMTVLRFGDGSPAAFDAATRLAYFLDRVKGGKGAW